MKSTCSSNGESVSNNIFQRNINAFGTKIYKLCDITVYTYDKNVYLGGLQAWGLGKGLTSPHCKPNFLQNVRIE